VVKFTEGAWLVVVIFPIAVTLLIRLNRQYRREARALEVISHLAATPAAHIRRNDIVILIDELDLATITAARYARSLRPASLRAVHFVLDDAHAEELREAWTAQTVLQQIPLHLVDCPDRRLERAVCELAVRETLDPGTELTFLLPRRTYPRILGRLLHDHTADDIARATSRLPRVVATAVPFDVAGLIERRTAAAAARQQAAGREVTSLRSPSTTSPDEPGTTGGGGRNDIPRDPGLSTAAIPSRRAPRSDRPSGGRPSPSPIATGESGVSDPAPKAQPVRDLQWRQRACIQGQVRSVRMAPLAGSPSVEIEVWDDTGGVTLIFYGRRHGRRAQRSLRHRQPALPASAGARDPLTAAFGDPGPRRLGTTTAASATAGRCPGRAGARSA